MKIKILFFVFLLHCLGHASEREKMVFRNLTPEMGLSHGDVLCIYQDHEDYIWIGTADGLNRYDGIEFTTYKYDRNDTCSLFSNYINSIREDSYHNLWIGTARGLCRYNRDKNNFERIIFYDNHNNQDENSITEIFEDKDGQLWIGCGQGVFIFDRDKKIFNTCFEEMFAQNELRSCSGICQDKNGDIWLSFYNSEDFGLIKYNSVTNEITSYHTRHPDIQLKENGIYSLMADNQNNIWIGYVSKGLDVYNVQSRTLRNYQQNYRYKNSLNNNSVFSIAQSKNGNIYIGTNGGGLNVFDPETELFSHYSATESERSVISNTVQYIYIGADGIIWIGCWGGGVSIYDKRFERFALYRHDKQDVHSLFGNSVTSFTQDLNGNIWIATDGGGINLFNTTEKRFTNFRSRRDDPRSLSNNKVLAVEADAKGGLWAGMWRGGLNYFQIRGKRLILKKKYTTIDENDPNSNSVFNIYYDKQGNLWVGTFQTGLYLFDPVSFKFKKIDLNYPQGRGFLFNGIHDILNDHEGNIWLATEGSGLMKIEQRTGECRFFVRNTNDSTSLISNYINVVYEDSHNRLWIGSFEGGLSLFNRQSETFINFTMGHGLPNSTVVGILEDSHSNLWISTSNGLSKIAVDSVNEQIQLSVRSYTVEDGLQSKVFNRWSFFKSRSGEMYFGGINGFNVFHPDSIRDNAYVPPVHITDFQLFNNPVPIGRDDSPLKKHISQTEKLVLNYNQNFFSFKFIALNYIYSEKNEYMYKMEGFDKEWNHIGNKREAIYTNISPGRYVFKVKGSNNDGLWNEEGRTLHIVIKPPFWKTWWFKGVMLFLGILTVVTIVEFRIRGINKQRKKLEQQVEERTEALQKSNIDLEAERSAVQNYAKALEQSNKELEAFSYSVSHDLRAPLRTMSSFSQILLEEYNDKLDSKGKDYLERIHQRSHQMGDLIDDLLKLSRLTRNEIYPEDMDLSRIVKALVIDFRQMQPSRKVEFVIAENQHVKGDKLLMEVMLRNLLDNAWKFTSKTKNAKIEFGSKKEKNRTVFFIKDNGIGFDMAYSEKLFQTFHRQRADFEGTGIGLATVKRIVERHKGNVWAEGKENEGAVFYFTIPESDSK